MTELPRTTSRGPPTRSRTGWRSTWRPRGETLNPSDTVWLGDLKSLWKETHFGADAKVLNAKLVKAFFATNATVEFKDYVRVSNVTKRDVFKGVKLAPIGV